MPLPSFRTDRIASAFIGLSLAYLLTGLLFGLLGSIQYVLPPFLREALSFQKSRPLHVYLVISWIFTAAQGCLYYFIPRYSGRPLAWKGGARLQLYMQALLSAGVIIAFFNGRFAGREYLEFPPLFGILILISWLPFAINFFATVKPNYRNAPVYIWSWSAGIIFFYITMSESYLWLIDYFRNNIVRDVTVQWKALGSMVGSWNMLVYGAAMFTMEKLSGNAASTRKPIPFFFFFLGFTNLMFNWGHHTYIVPAAPWVKQVAYIISMTELLLLGHIIFTWRKTLTRSQQQYHSLPYRIMGFADGWIFLNLSLAILISIPAINYYTHGTHITVAHAMGATIGINTMLLFAAISHVVQERNASAFNRNKKLLGSGAWITNIALIVFWFALLGSGWVKIQGKLEGVSFATMMERSRPFFKLFAGSGVFLMIGLLMMIIAVYRVVLSQRIPHHAAAPRETTPEAVL